MQEKIISLGAEIISVQPEIVTDDDRALMILLTLIVAILVGYSLSEWAMYNNYSVAGIISTLMTLGALAAFTFFALNLPQKETGATLYIIRASDQTDLSAILEEFHVINYEDYPILTVKAKIDQHV